MAENTSLDDDGVHETAMDYAEHERSYEIFISAVKWSVISTAVLVVLLYFIVQP